ncbi:MAG: phosphate signaling complex protein PhoU, partial [Calditrichaceae bacterium]
MTIHLHKAIENLKKKILTLGAMVEETVQNAVLALDSDDAELAREIIRNDTKIDDMEVEVEEECLKILALHQPVAIDLRYVVAVLKINSELERVGDLASNIAQRAIDLHDYPSVDFEFNFREMGEIAKSMLRSSLDALINLDSKQGR